MTRYPIGIRPLPASQTWIWRVPTPGHPRRADSRHRRAANRISRRPTISNRRRTRGRTPRPPRTAAGFGLPYPKMPVGPRLQRPASAASSTTRERRTSHARRHRPIRTTRARSAGERRIEVTLPGASVAAPCSCASTTSGRTPASASSRSFRRAGCVSVPVVWPARWSHAVGGDGVGSGGGLKAHGCRCSGPRRHATPWIADSEPTGSARARARDPRSAGCVPRPRATAPTGPLHSARTSARSRTASGAAARRPLSCSSPTTGVQDRAPPRALPSAPAAHVGSTAEYRLRALVGDADMVSTTTVVADAPCTIGAVKPPCGDPVSASLLARGGDGWVAVDADPEHVQPIERCASRSDGAAVEQHPVDDHPEPSAGNPRHPLIPGGSTGLQAASRTKRASAPNREQRGPPGRAGPRQKARARR